MTLTLIAVNVAMFVLTAISAGLGGQNPLDNYNSRIFAELAQVPALVDAGQWWRLVTAAFLHFGLVHLALNMLALLVFGSQLEFQLGRLRFGAVYLLSVLGGAAAIQLFASPGIFAAGASTGIWGLMGAFGVLAVARREDLRGIATLVALNVVISVVVPGISLLGHIGGLVAGALATAVLVLGRRSLAVQIAATAGLGVVLLVLALAVPAFGF
ncbi:rhomboid family intramembrane serine protease [Geodermatophilus sp. URMC 64]